MKNKEMKFKLPDHASVYTSEIYAIYRVIKYIREFCNIEQKKYLICSDSMAALQSLEMNNETNNYFVFQIMKLINQMTNC